MRELAFLNKGIRLTIKDMREILDNGNGGTPRTEVFLSDRGLVEFVEYLDANRERLTEKVIFISTDKYDSPVELALAV